MSQKRPGLYRLRAEGFFCGAEQLNQGCRRKTLPSVQGFGSLDNRLAPGLNRG